MQKYAHKVRFALHFFLFVLFLSLCHYAQDLEFLICSFFCNYEQWSLEEWKIETTEKRTDMVRGLLEESDRKQNEEKQSISTVRKVLLVYPSFLCYFLKNKFLFFFSSLFFFLKKVKRLLPSSSKFSKFSYFSLVNGDAEKI